MRTDSILIVGLGSMGKRRVRCLKALGYEKIYGFDLREDRRKETTEKYQIPTFDKVDEALNVANPKALIISVPPDVHHIYMKLALEKRLPFFVEASVTDQDMDLICEGSKNLKVLAAPSATLLFHPAIKTIASILKTKEIGKVSNITYHSGQYLPDWHTYEKVSDYYVSNPATGGAREIVPFELTWMVGLFGFPKKVTGNYRKTINITGAENIEDTYNFLMDYEDMLATVTVDCVSRTAVRRLLINGDKGQIVWSWDKPMVQVYNADTQAWSDRSYQMASAAAGYNANIGENMYIEELGSFLDAVDGKAPFINTLENDHRVLKLLYTIEESDKTGKIILF